ncbi:angiopoietin-related protein 4-like [Syngnathoides biaculeatus]|uniref:angiopoietin-related protein 4-like n=1 Tax=Syngnathoides biaculeatus TaxID=300417 RepID=UPI002ADD8FC6|nr:angiopoietin-related protein 4-like [Syngnathoides biaculeatus]
MTLQIIVLILVLHLNAAAAFPADGGDKYASWDEVNVLAHGLLQLGQGLKEHVDKTKVQMRDVNSQMKAFNGSVAALERKQREQDADHKARREEEERVDQKVEQVMKQTKDFHSRMNTLEKNVDELLNVTPDGSFGDNSTIPFIQRVVAAQNRRIDQLVDRIRQQQDKLDKQSLYMQTLQSKVAHKRVKFLRRRDEETTLRGEAALSQAETGRARDCHDLFLRGRRASGIFTIQPQNSQSFNVLCQMTSEGGWTVIQKRFDGSQNFNQFWERYKNGFGSLNGEFWLGLENIHAISKQGQYRLQVEITDWAGETQARQYRIQLDGEDKNYTLHIRQDSTSGVQGGGVLTGASGLPFSTADRDSDLAVDVNCAECHSGGWWFSDCGASNLNGKYPRRSGSLRAQPRRMFWTYAKGQNNSLRTTLMKLAPISINQQ